MRSLIKGQNDLETWCKSNNRQDLLDEWDPTNKIMPNQISYGSHMIVKWICKYGHHYEKAIHNRCKGTGCSACSGVNFEHRGQLFDEYPNLAKELDTIKNGYGIVKNYSSCSMKPIYWVCENGHSYDMPPARKIKTKGCPICNNTRVIEGVNDLKTWCETNGRTQILDDWDYSKNIVLPTEISFGSNRKVWFKCHVCKFEWRTVVSSRTSQHTDCKMCQRRLSSSFPEQCIFFYISHFFPDAVNGDRSILNGKEIDIYVPSLRFAIEYDGRTWHKDTSKDITKDELCEKEGVILYRVREYGCEELVSNNSITFEYEYKDWNALSKIIIDILTDVGVKNPNVNIVRDEYMIKEKYYIQTLENSLGKLYPEVSKEWCYEKNRNITPDLVSSQTHDRYYWRCPKCGKIYFASPHNRINIGSGCPDCGIKKRNKTQSFAVINLDTGERFETLYEAVTKYSLKKSALSACCRGVTKTCGGYRWAYDKSQLSESHIMASKRRSAANTVKQKHVLNIDTGIIYESAKDAQQKTGIHNISAVCRGVRSAAGGYHWQYID